MVRSPISGDCIAPIYIDPTPEPDCRPPFIYSDRAGGCIKPRPRRKPRENIAWIQGCLNTLGFNAGKEDGLTGRRTSAAWSSFRTANGLSGGAAYSNPETLALLYQQCQAPKKPQPVMPGPIDPPPADPLPLTPQQPVTPPPSNGADQFGLQSLKYRNAMCATGPLYTLLQNQYGNAISLEKCGTSCIPIPDGLSPQDAARQQRENGINWCRDCTKVGDNGILCPLPAPAENPQQ